jgi:hypothetical protein
VSKSKRPRKSYRPKRIVAPIMPELQRIMMFDGHGAITALQHAPNYAALDQLVGIFNAMSVALADSGRKSIILESGLRTLQDVVNRYNNSGEIFLRPFEVPAICNAMIECEQLIKKMDVVGLHTARIKAEALQQMSIRANAPLEQP